MSPLCNLLFLIIFLHTSVSLAYDPNPIQDFCVASEQHHPPKINFLSCKNSSEVNVEDFIYSDIKSPGKFVKETGLAAKSVNVNVFPGLNTLGMSFVRADFEEDGINVPHYHPRATEVAFVLEGKVYSGFVDTENRVFAKVIEKGDVMVFPKGLVHFQINVGDKPATILGSFDSQNPGVMRIPTAIFGSGIKEEVLEKAFGLNSKELAKLRKKLTPVPN
ncbi:hypothetical protein ACFE04_003552 [Oxalis oulophora]